MNVYDEIYKQNYFQHILNRHEQASILAAEGYARATGKLGCYSYKVDQDLQMQLLELLMLIWILFHWL